VDKFNTEGRPLFGGNYERAGGGLQKRENILKPGLVTVNSRVVIQIQAGNSCGSQGIFISRCQCMPHIGMPFISCHSCNKIRENTHVPGPEKCRELFFFMGYKTGVGN